MARRTPTETAALWASRTAGSTEAYKQGIQRVQGSPMAKAVAAQDRMRANFNESVDSGRWAANTGAVSESAWKQACTDKGAANLGTAARAAQDKVARSEARMQPIRDSIVSGLPERGDINQNIERSRQMQLKMHESRKRG